LKSYKEGEKNKKKKKKKKSAGLKKVPSSDPGTADFSSWQEMFHSHLPNGPGIW